MGREGERGDREGILTFLGNDVLLMIFSMFRDSRDGGGRWQWHLVFFVFLLANTCSWPPKVQAVGEPSPLPQFRFQDGVWRARQDWPVGEEGHVFRVEHSPTARYCDAGSLACVRARTHARTFFALRLVFAAPRLIRRNVEVSRCGCTAKF